MAKVLIQNYWEYKEEVWYQQMSLQQIVVLNHKYLNPIRKPTNFKKRTMKSKDKESVLP